MVLTSSLKLTIHPYRFKNKLVMKYITLIILLCLSSCSKKTYHKFEYNKSENPWVGAFKDKVFFTILKESYKNDTIFQLIEKKDAFNPYDNLSPDALDQIKELAKDLIKNMPKPTMCENCKDGENYYMANALHYYSSHELDSIANAAYKKQMRLDKELYK
jgi:hypothetical protein